MIRSTLRRGLHIAKQLRWCTMQPWDAPVLKRLEGKGMMEVGRATDLLVDDPWDEDFMQGDAGNDVRVGEIEGEFMRYLEERRKDDQVVAMSLHLAGVYIKNYKLDKAEAMLDRLLPWCRSAQGPFLWKILQKIATLRFKQNRQPECAELLEELASIAPPNAATHANLTTAYNSMGEYEKALEHIEKGIALKGYVDKDDKWALGLVKKNLGEVEEGLRYLEEALVEHYKEIPDDKVMIAKLHDSLGDAYVKSGNLAKAEEHYLTAYRYFQGTVGDSSPLTGSAAGLLGKVYLQQGNKAEARKYLIKSLEVEAHKDGIHCTPLYDLISTILTIHVEESVPEEEGGLRDIHPMIEAAIVNLDKRGDLVDGNGGVLLHKMGEAFLLAQPNEHIKAYKTFARAKYLLENETQADLSSLLDILAIEMSAAAQYVPQHIKDEVESQWGSSRTVGRVATPTPRRPSPSEPVTEEDRLRAENIRLKEENAKLRAILHKVREGFKALDGLDTI